MDAINLFTTLPYDILVGQLSTKLRVPDLGRFLSACKHTYGCAARCWEREIAYLGEEEVLACVKEKFKEPDYASLAHFLWTNPSALWDSARLCSPIRGNSYFDFCPLSKGQLISAKEDTRYHIEVRSHASQEVIKLTAKELGIPTELEGRALQLSGCDLSYCLCAFSDSLVVIFGQYVYTAPGGKRKEVPIVSLVKSKEDGLLDLASIQHQALHGIASATPIAIEKWDENEVAIHHLLHGQGRGTTVPQTIFFNVHTKVLNPNPHLTQQQAGYLWLKLKQPTLASWTDLETQQDYYQVKIQSGAVQIDLTSPPVPSPPLPAKAPQQRQRRAMILNISGKGRGAVGAKKAEKMPKKVKETAQKIETTATCQWLPGVFLIALENQTIHRYPPYGARTKLFEADQNITELCAVSPTRFLFKTESNEIHEVFFKGP